MVEGTRRESRKVSLDGRANSPRRSFARNASRSALASVRVRALRVFILHAPFASA